MDNRNLRRIREVNWAEIEAEEARWLRQLTVEEGIRDYLALRQEFGLVLERDEALYGTDYEPRLIQIQQRLQRLEEWKGKERRMDILIDALIELQSRLDKAGIPSAAIGGLAIGAWARARATRDADVKVLLHRKDRKRLLDLLGQDYRPLHADPDSALRHNGILFVLNAANVRLDIMLADTEFDEMLIARARNVELSPDRIVRVCSPEDLVVLKMIAFRPQDQIDVANVVQRQGKKLDDDYILDWLGKFEKALDDSTLVREYRQIKERYSRS